MIFQEKPHLRSVEMHHRLQHESDSSLQGLKLKGWEWEIYSAYQSIYQRRKTFRENKKLNNPQRGDNDLFPIFFL